MIKNYREQIAKEIIDAIEKGVAPWQKDWIEERPVNLNSGRPYNGINQLRLELKNYKDPRWLTFKQVQELGATVKKGSKATAVVYWKFREKVKQLDENGQVVLDNEGKPKYSEIELDKPKTFVAWVFNAQQCDGLPEYKKQSHNWDISDQAEKIIKESKAKIQEGRSPIYHLQTDSIELPPKNHFQTPDAYYAAALHELSHWTGHKTRLNRGNENAPFGSKEYAREELVAEIAAYMIGKDLKLNHKSVNSPAYIKSWLNLLKKDYNEIFRAAVAAEKAKNYLCNSLVQTEEIKEQKEVKTEQKQEKHVYLNVPYEKKELAKELGAKWDRQALSWYVNADVELKPFKEFLTVSKQNETMEKAADMKILLNVPYEQRQEAKALGAKWDKELKSWYITNQQDRNKFKQWEKARDYKVTSVATQNVDPVAEFSAFLRSHGCVVDGIPVMDGKGRRIILETDRPGQKTGFYVGYLDGVPAGYFKDNRTGVEARWKATTNQKLSDVDKQSLLKEAELKKSQRLEQAKQLRAEAIKNLSYQIEKGNYAEINDVGEASYFKNKKIEQVPAGLRQTEKTIVMPIYDVDNKLVSAQFINKETGQKLIAKNTSINGDFHPVGGFEKMEKAKTVIVAEGLATAISLSEALKDESVVCVAAINSGNLAKVAEKLNEKYSEKIFVIAGDNDMHLEINVGKEAAQKAGESINAKVVVPMFTQAEQKNKLSDFNDMAQIPGGQEKVRVIIKTAINESTKLKMQKSSRKEQKQNLEKNKITSSGQPAKKVVRR